MTRLRRLALVALWTLCAAPSAALTVACDAPKGGLSEMDGEIEADEVEPCDAAGEARDCDDGGVQYCDMIDDEIQWGACLMSQECEPGETFGCGLGLGITYSCYLEQGVPTIPQDACNTPLVLRFDDAPVRFASSAASFDINGAGTCLNTDWPTAETPWLAIDRDGNGAIDGGHELFGTGTVLDSGIHAVNGFLALDELDSDGDGAITRADKRFDELVLWSDHDADRRSSLSELRPVKSVGLQAIELSYTHSRSCDERGNCEGPRARFEYTGADGRARAGEVIDVSMACQ